MFILQLETFNSLQKIFFSVLPTGLKPAKISDIFQKNLPLRNFSICNGFSARATTVEFCRQDPHSGCHITGVPPLPPLCSISQNLGKTKFLPVLPMVAALCTKYVDYSKLMQGVTLCKAPISLVQIRLRPNICI